MYHIRLIVWTSQCPHENKETYIATCSIIISATNIHPTLLEIWDSASRDSRIMSSAARVSQLFFMVLSYRSKLQQKCITLPIWLHIHVNTSCKDFRKVNSISISIHMCALIYIHMHADTCTYKCTQTCLCYVYNLSLDMPLFYKINYKYIKHGNKVLYSGPI